jgi:DHA1 family bicyclomycin/chloramphenicol resistance-like MFS transporter
MLGAGISARLAHRWPATRTIALGLGLTGLAVVGNLAQMVLLPPNALNVLAPLVLYACGLAVAMPPLTVRALDCFPAHRGSAASMQGFVQMTINAGVAGLAVPLLQHRLGHFVLGQAAFLSLAQLLWWLPAYRAARRS